MGNVRTVDIEMQPPTSWEVRKHPFTEADLEAISRRHGEILSEPTNVDRDVDEVMSEWTLAEGFLIYRPMGAIRIGRGTVRGETAWWVDVENVVSPCCGRPVVGWKYQAHFPGIFTAEWVNWIYWNLVS